jgi:hypothetical protein
VRVGLEVEARERCYIAGLGFCGCIWVGPLSWAVWNFLWMETNIVAQYVRAEVLRIDPFYK